MKKSRGAAGKSGKVDLSGKSTGAARTGGSDGGFPGFRDGVLFWSGILPAKSRVKMDEHFRTSLRGLHCLGDSSGWTRGLMMSSVMGVLMGRELVGEE